MSSTLTAPQDTTISSKPQQTQPSVSQPQQNAAPNTRASGINANDIVSSDREGADRLAGRTRAGSAGSKRSRNAGAMSTEKGTRPASTGAQNQGTAPRAKKKSGFLSFLNCCGAPDQENEIGMNEPAQPAKQVSTAQPTKTQPSAAQIAAQKASTSSAQNTETGLPQASDEKASGSLLTKDQSSRIGNSSDEKDAHTGNLVPEQTMTDAPVLSSTIPTTNEESSRPKSQAPYLPPIATGAAIGAAGGLGVGAIAEYAMESNPNVTVQAPTPISQPEHEVAPVAPVVADPDELISDRTPEQQARDTDIEMTDNGPSLPLSSNDVNSQPSDEHETVSKRESVINLPPPPPLEERQAQMAVASGVTPTSEISRQPSPVESQRGLLPVVRPEHKGRKCLILDLDETLVHSSFKVSHLVNSESVMY